MKDDKKYSPECFDIDALASLSRLSLSDNERQSFLADIADMANYTYNKLQCESADGALAVCTFGVKTLDGLREDVCESCEDADAILGNAPDLADRYIRVPKAVSSTEGRK